MISDENRMIISSADDSELSRMVKAIDTNLGEDSEYSEILYDRAIMVRMLQELKKISNNTFALLSAMQKPVYPDANGEPAKTEFPSEQ